MKLLNFIVLFCGIVVFSNSAVFENRGVGRRIVLLVWVVRIVVPAKTVSIASIAMQAVVVVYVLQVLL